MQPESASSASAVWVEMKISSGSHSCPDRIERLQPVEQVGILRGRDRTRQGLVKMMMRIDQARQDDVPARIEDDQPWEEALLWDQPAR